MNKKVLMIGPHADGQGGIASVIGAFYKSKVFRDAKISFLPTHTERNKFIKMLYFFFSLFGVLPYLFDSSTRIFHIHMSSQASFYRKSIILLLANLFNKKVIIQIHGSKFNSFFENNRFLVRFMLSRADMILALSKRWKRDLDQMVTNPSKVRVFYNPVSIRSFHVVKHSSRVPTILFLGRLGKRKGTYDLIESIKLMRNKDFVLNLCGDGDLKEIKSLIKKYDLLDKVNVLGWVRGHEKIKLLKAADIYVLPSYNEGLPMSILEAMSYGLPVLSTDVGGISEAVHHAKNGFIIKPGDVRAMAKFLSRLISNPGLRRRMGRRSYLLVKKNFDVNKLAHELRSIYDEL